jgi:hypothetical protein
MSRRGPDDQSGGGSLLMIRVALKFHQEVIFSDTSGKEGATIIALNIAFVCLLLWASEGDSRSFKITPSLHHREA